MFVVRARYRGKELRRAALVKKSAAALATLPGADTFHVVGVEDVEGVLTTAEATCDVVMALLSHGDWAIAIAAAPTEEQARTMAAKLLGAQGRAGTVCVDARLAARGSRQHAKALAADITAVFVLLGHILSRRTMEGREATALVRSGLNQNESAEQLGISKQAMSQRLQAAGWNAELSGWRLAIRLLGQVL